MAIEELEQPFFSGERATDAEIRIMEHVATELMTDQPAEIRREYGYRTDSGSVVSFHMGEKEVYIDDEETQTKIVSYAAVVLSKIAEGPKLGVEFGFDNELVPLGNVTDEELFAGRAILKDVLDNEPLLQPEDRAVVSHLAEVFALTHKEWPTGTGILRKIDAVHGRNYIADVIKHQVIRNTPYALLEKEWGLGLNDHEIVHIKSEEIVFIGAELSDTEDGDEDMPTPDVTITYEIMVNDNPDLVEHSPATYVFRRFENGSTVLRTRLFGNVDSDTVPSEEIDDAIEAFRWENGFDTPSKAGIEMMSLALLRAAAINSEVH